LFSPIFCDKIRGKNLKKIKTKKFLAAILGIFFPILAAHAALSVAATDTIAGYSAALKSSVGAPNATVVFVVEKPDGGKIRIEEKPMKPASRARIFSDFTPKKRENTPFLPSKKPTKKTRKTRRERLLKFSPTPFRRRRQKSSPSATPRRRTEKPPPKFASFCAIGTAILLKITPFF